MKNSNPSNRALQKTRILKIIETPAVWGNICHFQGSISQFYPQVSTYNSIFQPKTYPGGSNNFVWPYLSKGRLNLWAKYSKPRKKIKKYFFFSELQELEVRICVQPNFPIIILILLNGFHKFQGSRGLISSASFQSITTATKNGAQYLPTQLFG